ncbi:MAG: PAS domain S-box protein [Curvibacter lanceolatus]|jgi:PAS domain S-box-containing protein|uniref:ATP-binding protein n=1 Tax=Curvibacter lanceolatus TaxID=86182 RepID=UPI0003684D65|nr:ATP-binding protein [Curvibacter lanceolatus]MBV5294910.1 PAS domain S-box protein [Curvibacter lanceolatus]
MEYSELDILEAVSQPLFAYDGQAIVHANQKMLRLIGLSLSDLQALDPLSIFPDEHRAMITQYLDECLDGEGLSPSIELNILSASGLKRNIEIAGVKRRVADRSMVICTCQDLSDIKIVQDSLMEMGQRLNQIIENDPVATLVMTAEHVVTHWNSAAEQLTGVSKGAMIGNREAWRPFYPSPRPILADLIIEGSVESAMPSLYKGRGRRSALISNAVEAEDFFPDIGDSGAWLYFSAAPLYDSKDRLVGAIETLQDVTSRRDAEDALRRQQLALEWTVAERTAEVRAQHRQIEALLENAPIGIVQLQDGLISRVNNTFVEMFELQETPIQTLRVNHIFASRDDYEFIRKMAGPMLKAGTAFNYEARMRTSLGNERWIQLIGYPANPGAGDESSWWLLLDRTDIKTAHESLQKNFDRITDINAKLEEAQNQLLQSEKMASIGQLAAGVAHEINNPLGFVSSNIGALGRYSANLLALGHAVDRELKDKALASEDDSPWGRLAQCFSGFDFEFLAEDLPDLLAETEDGLSRVKRIVQDLKDFSRVDHEEWAEADINQGLDSTLNVVRNEVKYKAEVVKRYGQLPRVKCLAAQINQVLMNLIVNAAQAIKDKGVITLETEVRGDWIAISVSDTGCGMNDEVRKRIFEPFYTTKPVGQGTGLGLSLSYSIVQKHGGRIEVESSPGTGTKFTVHLPIACVPQPSQN